MRTHALDVAKQNLYTPLLNMLQAEEGKRKKTIVANADLLFRLHGLLQKDELEAIDAKGIITEAVKKNMETPPLHYDVLRQSVRALNTTFKLPAPVLLIASLGISAKVRTLIASTNPLVDLALAVHTVAGPLVDPCIVGGAWAVARKVSSLFGTDPSKNDIAKASAEPFDVLSHMTIDLFNHDNIIMPRGTLPLSYMMQPMDKRTTDPKIQQVQRKVFEELIKAAEIRRASLAV